MKKIKHFFIIILFYVMRIFPIKKNKVVFSNFAGRGFGDNCKYIALELLKLPHKYDIVWLCKGTEQTIPKGIRPVKYFSVRSIFEQATAKIWVDNRRKPEYVRKRKGQFYIQTWHGMTALKKVEKDVEKNLSTEYVYAAKRDSKMIDLFITVSKWEKEKIKSSFWYNGEIAECGYPRDDILYLNNQKLIESIKKHLGIESGKKIVLYAPTFRVSQNHESLKLYSIDWIIVLKALKEKFGGDWVGLIRLHPGISSLGMQINSSENVINVTDYPDMQELLLVSDAMITDYSSSILEFSIMRKPGFVYAVDIPDYKNDRGSYYNLHDLPYGVSETIEELVDLIQKFDTIDYNKKLDNFFYNRYQIYKAGNASEYIAKIIENNSINKGRNK